MTRILFRQGWRFSLVGLLNTMVDLSVFTALVYIAGTAPVAANILSYFIGTATSYVCNSAWTFAKTDRSFTLKSFVLFVSANLVGLVLSTVFVAGLVVFVPALLAKLVATAVTFVWNFVLARYILGGYRSAIN